MGANVSDTAKTDALGKRAPASVGFVSPASHNAALGQNTDNPIIVVSDVDYSLHIAGKPLDILKKVSISVAPAQVVAIVGPSGSGKTSLLMLLAGLERASSGTVRVAGHDLSSQSEDQLAVFRRKTLGIVFQSFHLIPSLTALDNVGLALEIAQPGLSMTEVRAAAAEALAAVGLGDRLAHRPSALSGGEQQRVGLARAMVAKLPLLLADEPTGNLDQTTGAVVIDLMFDLARRTRTAVVLITHDPGLAERADRVFTMTAGQLTETTAGKA